MSLNNHTNNNYEKKSKNNNLSWTQNITIPDHEITYHKELYNKLLFKNFWEEEKIPTKVYVNCPIIYTNLVTDISSPNTQIDIQHSLDIKEYEKQWRPTPLNVVLENNWTFKQRGAYLNFLIFLWQYLDNNKDYNLHWYIKFFIIEELLSWKNTKEVAISLCKKLEELWLDNDMLKHFKKEIEKWDDLKYNDYNKIPTILWYHFRWSDFIPFDKKEELIKLLNQDEVYSLLWNFLSINEDYVYRAITEEEWELIKKEKWWTIPESTNFEWEIWIQVSLHSKKKWYAWIIIRIKAIKTCYKYWWIQVKRIECYKPHYTKDIEFQTKAWEWLSIEEYK